MLGEIKRNTKTALEVEVIHNNKVIAIHRYNKDYGSHSITEVGKVNSDLLLEVFQDSKVLVDSLLRRM